MIRWSGIIFRVTSLLVCLVSAALWISSYVYSASLDFNIGSGSHCEVLFWPGQLGVAVFDGNGYVGLPPRWNVARRVGPPGWSGYPTPFGLTVMSLPSPPNPFLPKGWRVVIAFWLPTVAGAVAPLVHAARWLCRRGVGTGVCPGCGYDLRATPDRCPECGREIHLKNAPA